MAFEKPAVIIDNGSHLLKAGFSCDNHPVSIFRTVVGRPAHLHGKYGRTEFYHVYIGDEAVARAGEYELNCPIVNGKIQHWDNMERVWHHVFYRELKVAPEDRAVIMACSPSTTMAEKIKCCQVYFETLNVPALCVQSQSVLALFGSGLTTGMAVDIGFDTTDVTPVFEGRNILYANMQTGFAGEKVLTYIQESLAKRNCSLGVEGVSALEVIDDIVMKKLYVTRDAAFRRSDREKPYTLPDGTVINVGLEAFMAGELMFQPDLVAGKQTGFLSLQDAVIKSVWKCDPDLRSELYSGIVLCGGMTMIPGIGLRLKDELENSLEKMVNVVTSEESYVVAWMGAATFAGIPDAQRMWVTKKQYEDQGAKIIRNRFI